MQAEDKIIAQLSLVEAEIRVILKGLGSKEISEGSAYHVSRYGEGWINVITVRDRLQYLLGQREAYKLILR